MNVCRVAAHHVCLDGVEQYKNGVVELKGKEVVNFYPLSGELSFTEWIGGTINICNTQYGIHAYKNGEILERG